jgi:hypothetical protein
MSNAAEMNTCCHCSQPEQMELLPVHSFSKIKQTTRSIPSIMMSVLIAFFPKCPVCWAVYMSLFGSLGLAKLPYIPWLLPVLFCFLGIHLFLLFKKVPQKGYLPFALSLAGALVILSGRSFFPLEKWILITGMVLIISGSLLNSFSGVRLSLKSI